VAVCVGVDLLGVGGWCWQPSSAIEAGQCGCGEPSAGGGELGVNKINIYIYTLLMIKSNLVDAHVMHRLSLMNPL
jgi:hypothetical protein